jgi:hypothetical protein
MGNHDSYSDFEIESVLLKYGTKTGDVKLGQKGRSLIPIH